MYPLDAVFDTPADIPDDVKNNKRYAGLDGFTISEVADKIAADYGKIDILVHSPCKWAGGDQAAARDLAARLSRRLFRVRILNGLAHSVIRSHHERGRRGSLAHLHRLRKGDPRIRWGHVVCEVRTRV